MSVSANYHHNANNYELYLYIDGSKGALWSCAPHFSNQISSISCTFWEKIAKIIDWYTPLWGWRPRLGNHGNFWIKMTYRNTPGKHFFSSVVNICAQVPFILVLFWQTNSGKARHVVFFNKVEAWCMLVPKLCQGNSASKTDHRWRFASFMSDTRIWNFVLQRNLWFYDSCRWRYLWE